MNRSKIEVLNLVEDNGVEPMTSCMPCKRSSQLNTLVINILHPIKQNRYPNVTQLAFIICKNTKLIYHFILKAQTCSLSTDGHPLALQVHHLAV